MFFSEASTADKLVKVDVTDKSIHVNYKKIDIGFLTEKCCFPLAEARKKRKTFFSHTSGSLGASVRGVEVTWLMRFPTFLVAVRHCLTFQHLVFCFFAFYSSIRPVCHGKG